MPSINKTSVRDEVEKIKVSFNQLCNDGKVSPEVLMLINSMFMIVELILSIFLEKTTKKTNQNSSKPSSQTQKDESSIGSLGSHGKGKQTENTIFENTRVKETVTLSRIQACDCCGEDLGKVAATEHERRTKIDIMFEKVVEHFDAEIKECPTCQSTVKAAFPAEIKSPLQYGSGLKSTIINLVVSQMVALKRVQTWVQTTFSVALSEATILKFILRLHQALADWETQSRHYLLKQPAMHVDETSLRVDKKNQWVHVYSAGEVTLKFLHPYRGKEAIEDIAIIPQYGGVIIHDCWASYLAYSHCEHGLCGSHLLRELTFIVESNGYAFAKRMKRLLQVACKKVSTSAEKILTVKEYALLRKCYQHVLARAEKELPPIPERTDGKRGKIAKSDAHNLWARLKEHESAVLLFAKNPHVAFTNNRAERDLRMAKVKQKVSGCFRKQIFAQAYCRISSYLQTMATKGINPLVAIQMVINHNIQFQGE